MPTYLTPTPLGWVAWRESARGVCACCLPQPTGAAALAALGASAAEEVDPTRHVLAGRLVRYYGGERQDLRDVPLDLGAETEFQAAVRAVVRAIAPGRVRSYGQVAAAVGRPGAARAVGRVMATNPVPPFVPCHRVVAADGGLGGFSGGLALKATLLAQEGYRCERSWCGGSAERLSC
jgi:methylated-DNA-[protein]-cysteine S-methyltransferase